MTSREARITALLAYALKREGICPESYIISEGADVINADDKHVLMRLSGERWIVYYCERGKREILGEFDDIFNASRFFYWQMTRARSHFFYREEFDRRDAAEDPNPDYI